MLGYHQIGIVHTLNGMVSWSRCESLFDAQLAGFTGATNWCICTEISLLTCSNHCIHHDLIQIDVTWRKGRGLERKNTASGVEKRYNLSLFVPARFGVR